MIQANFNAYNTYVTDSLVQWDVNQDLEISGLNLATAPEVHFTNVNMDKAIVKQTTLTDGVVTVRIPNSLLQQSVTINAYIGIYENDTFKTIEVVNIPIIARERPTDYTLTDSDEEIYSFKKLENDLANTEIKANRYTDDTVKQLTARVDNLITHNNDTEGNSELFDIRVGADGAVYDTAGEAVRGQIKRLNDDIDKYFLIGKNKISESSLIFGEAVRSDGTIITNSNFKRTDYIYLEAGTYIYSANSLTNANIGVFDLNKNVERTILKSGLIVIDTPKYIVISNLITSSRWQLESATATDTDGNYIATEYEKAYVQLSNDVFKDHFLGKTILFEGDSITAGTGFTKPEMKSIIYPALVANALGMKIINNAIGGSTVASKPPETENTKSPLVLRYEALPDDVDIVYIAIGTNDWAYSYTPIGTMEDRADVLDESGNSKATPYTFYGALHILCRGLLNKYVGKPIIFATPIKRRLTESATSPISDRKNGKTLKEYGEIIKEVCDFYSIPVIDMYSECNITPFVNEQRDAFFQEKSGGTHPNAQGQQVMARRVIAGLKSIIGS